jgi:hypothetical protein
MQMEGKFIFLLHQQCHPTPPQGEQKALHIVYEWNDDSIDDKQQGMTVRLPRFYYGQIHTTVLLGKLPILHHPLDARGAVFQGCCLVGLSVGL